MEEYELKYRSYTKKLIKHWFKKDEIKFSLDGKFNGDDWRSQQLQETVSHLKDCKIKIVYYFENKAYLALNHWIGVMRISLSDGQWFQYLVSTAAGKDDCVQRLEESMVKTLVYYDFNFEQNKVYVEKINLQEVIDKELERY